MLFAVHEMMDFSMNEKEITYRQPLYRRRPLRFSCTRCGECCTGNDDYHVYVNDTEVEKIRAFLGIGRSWFRRRYLTRDEDGGLILQARENGDCVMLTKEGGCRVYAARPVQCATYPFWPEVVKTTAAWRRERQRCEGIDYGEIVPVEQIEKALQLCREAEGDQ